MPYSNFPEDEIIGAIMFISLLLAIIFVVSAIICVFDAKADEIAIKTIAYEASNQPLSVQVLVGRVIRQRMKERRLDAKSVCLERKQFSCWDKGARLKPRTEKELRKAKKAWELSAGLDLKVNLYHDLNYYPYWTRSKRVKFVKRAGRIKFYYEKRG